MKSFLIFLWLRWHLMINEIKTSVFPVSRNLHFAFIIIYFVVFFGLGVFCSFFIGLSAKYEGSKNWLQNTNSVVSFVLLCIFFGKIFSSGEIIKRVSTNVLRHYPISSLAIYLFDMLFRLIDRWYLMLACFLFGFIIGFGLKAVLIFTTLELLIHAILIVLCLYFFIEIIEEIVHLIVLCSWKAIVCSFSAILLILLFYFKDVKYFFGQFFAFIQTYTPVWFLSTSLYELHVNNQSYTVINELYKSTLFVSSLLIGLILFYAFRSIIISKHSRINIIIREKKFNLSFDFITSFLPWKLTQYILKDIRYFFRSRSTQVLIILEIILFVYIYYQMSSHSKSMKEYYLIFSLLFFTLITWETYLSNYFGMDKIAFGFYLYSPTSSVSLIISKNISFLILQLPFIILSWFFCGFLLSPTILSLFMLGQISMFCLFMMFGNINSIKTAHPVERNDKIFSRSSSQKFSLIGFVGIIVCIVFSITIALVIWKLKNSVISYSIVCLMAIISSTFYCITTLKAHKLFFESSETIFLTLRKS